MKNKEVLLEMVEKLEGLIDTDLIVVSKEIDNIKTFINNNF